MDFPIWHLHVCDLLSSQTETYSSLGHLGGDIGGDMIVTTGMSRAKDSLPSLSYPNI